mmetsp:Transcript_18913/g.45102  ORF Transcript_18913/g.45102 Transcript_18913/m.45102 type:complete len:270 (+) Transcript_18913:2803-3612(+)
MCNRPVLLFQDERAELYESFILKETRAVQQHLTDPRVQDRKLGKRVKDLTSWIGTTGSTMDDVTGSQELLLRQVAEPLLSARHAREDPTQRLLNESRLEHGQELTGVSQVIGPPVSDKCHASLIQDKVTRRRLAEVADKGHALQKLHCLLDRALRFRVQGLGWRCGAQTTAHHALDREPVQLPSLRWDAAALLENADHEAQKKRVGEQLRVVLGHGLQVTPEHLLLGIVADSMMDDCTRHVFIQRLDFQRLKLRQPQPHTAFCVAGGAR